MGLFGFGKKKKAETCGCGCACGAEPVENEVVVNEKGEEMAECECGGMCPVSEIEAKKAQEKRANETGNSIKVLGPGCKKCAALEEATKEALQSMGEPTSIDHVTDYAEIASYGVMNTPALVVDGKVVSMGKVLSSKEVEAILQTARG